MPLTVGDRLGPCEILAPIGAGGMLSSIALDRAGLCVGYFVQYEGHVADVFLGQQEAVYRAASQ